MYRLNLHLMPYPNTITEVLRCCDEQVLDGGVAADSAAAATSAGPGGVLSEERRGAEDAQTSVTVVRSTNDYEKGPGDGPVSLVSRQREALLAMVATERTLCESELSGGSKS